MYAGFIIEESPVKELYVSPRHPYTLGLLGSLPRADEAQPQRLIPIEGLPPDLLILPQGCPFAPRCAYKVDRCCEENPTLETVSPGHKKACWVDTRQGRQQ
jgi:oligopeptide transport system ATP-binding protein